MKSLTRRPRVLSASILATSLIIVAALVALQSLLAQPRGWCVVTELPGHLVLPDGKVYEAGELTTRVPVFVFTPRTEHHHVRLLGYAWPDGDGMSVHVLHRPGQKVAPSLLHASALPERADEQRYVLVAARAE